MAASAIEFAKERIQYAVERISDGAAVNVALDDAEAAIAGLRNSKDKTRLRFLIKLVRSRAAATPQQSSPQTVVSPLPLPIRIAADDTKSADPNKMPDRLDATLKNADPEKNPELRPFNRPGNFNPNFTLDDVAGADDAKALLRRALIDPYNAPVLYPPSLVTRGILLYGVAGTGKTTLAAAAINALAGTRSADEVSRLSANSKLPGFVERNFPDRVVPRVIYFQVSVADVKSVWVGESSRRLERWFELARECAPSIIFFDEAETYLDESDEHNSDTITTFKQQFGGLASGPTGEDGGGGGGVTLIVATNYPMKIESAIRSRLTGTVEIGLPGAAARRALIARAIDDSFVKSGLPEGVWVVDRENTIARMVAATAPPRNIEEFRLGEKKLWSGRDLSALVFMMLSMARSNIVDGYVKSCATNACEWYMAGQDVYVEATEGEAGAVPTRSILGDARKKLRPSPITWKDFETARTKFNPSVDRESVRNQVLFNASRGISPRVGEGEERTQTFVNDFLADRVGGPYIGANTTVPID